MITPIGVYFIFIYGFLAGGKHCTGDEYGEMRKIRKNTSDLVEQMKNEIVSESDIETNDALDDVRRDKIWNGKKGTVSSDSSTFLANIKEEMVAKNEEEASRGKQRGKNYCVHCEIQFRFHTTYERHFREKHPDKYPYNCPYCDSKQMLKRNSDGHARRKHPDKFDFVSRNKKFRKLACELCNTAPMDDKALEQHALKAHKDVRTRKCSECDASFFRRRQFNRHMLLKHRYKEENDALKCKECNIVYESSDVMESHTAVCRQREKIAIKMDMSEWEKWTRRTVCKNCGVKFASLAKLKEHTRENHPEMRGIYACEKCDKSFTRSESLESHVGRYHPYSNDIDLKQKYRKWMKYGCHVCGEEFEGLRNYENHSVTRHPNEKPFECGTCGMAFKRKCLLLTHFRNMHGGEILPCSYCTKCFSLKSTLNYHEKKCGKNGKRPVGDEYFCDICSKWWNGTLSRHKQHHHDYDYCDFCSTRFHKIRNPDGLSKHLDKRHPNAPLTAGKGMTNSQRTEIKQEKYEYD